MYIAASLNVIEELTRQLPSQPYQDMGRQV